MKQITLCICTAAIVLALISSFTLIKGKSNVISDRSENELIEITPLIQSTVMLYDTTKFINGVKYANSPKDYNEVARTKFLTYSSFNSLKAQLQITYNDHKSLIYFDAEAGNVSTTSERKMQEAKDLFKKVNILTFFESWYYNKHTGEIIKKQLGYSVGQWDYEKQAFREWYLYFTSQQARAIYLKNW